jgi:hypothetical protein
MLGNEFGHGFSNDFLDVLIALFDSSCFFSLFTVRFTWWAGKSDGFGRCEESGDHNGGLEELHVYFMYNFYKIILI